MSLTSNDKMKIKSAQYEAALLRELHAERAEQLDVEDQMDSESETFLNSFLQSRACRDIDSLIFANENLRRNFSRLDFHHSSLMSVDHALHVATTLLINYLINTKEHNYVLTSIQMALREARANENTDPLSDLTTDQLSDMRSWLVDARPGIVARTNNTFADAILTFASTVKRLLPSIWHKWSNTAPDVPDTLLFIDSRVLAVDLLTSARQSKYAKLQSIAAMGASITRRGFTLLQSMFGDFGPTNVVDIPAAENAAESCMLRPSINIDAPQSERLHVVDRLGSDVIHRVVPLTPLATTNPRLWVRATAMCREWTLVRAGPEVNADEQRAEIDTSIQMLGCSGNDAERSVFLPSGHRSLQLHRDLGERMASFLLQRMHLARRRRAQISLKLCVYVKHYVVVALANAALEIEGDSAFNDVLRGIMGDILPIGEDDMVDFTDREVRAAALRHIDVRMNEIGEMNPSRENLAALLDQTPRIQTAFANAAIDEQLAEHHAVAEWKATWVVLTSFLMRTLADIANTMETEPLAVGEKIGIFGNKGDVFEVLEVHEEPDSYRIRNNSKMMRRALDMRLASMQVIISRSKIDTDGASGRRLLMRTHSMRMAQLLGTRIPASSDFGDLAHTLQRHTFLLEASVQRILAFRQSFDTTAWMAPTGMLGLAPFNIYSYLTRDIQTTFQRLRRLRALDIAEDGAEKEALRAELESDRRVVLGAGPLPPITRFRQLFNYDELSLHDEAQILELFFMEQIVRDDTWRQLKRFAEQYTVARLAMGLLRISEASAEMRETLLILRRCS